MGKKIESIIGFVILIGVIIVFGVGLYYSQPSKNDIDKYKTIKQTQIPDNVLNYDAMQKIRSLEVNGNVPVVVSDNEVGRPNPFVPF